MPAITRRSALTALTGSLAAATFRPARAAANKVKISYQSASTLWVTVKTSGDLDRRLAALGYDTEWTQAIDLASLMKSGAVDFHADVADAVPIFTQAARADIAYYAKENPAPSAQAIIVPKGSPIQSLADLKGKRVGVLRGSGCHYLLIVNLAKAGLTIKDITPAYLSAPDANAAFATGTIDAWAIWDPFLAQAEVNSGARVLVDGSNGTSTYKRYYFVGREYAERHPEVVKTVFQALQDAGKWVKSHEQESADMLSPFWGNMPVSTVRKIGARRSYDLQPIVVADDFPEQQRIADTFFDAGLLPNRVDIKQAAVVNLA